MGQFGPRDVVTAAAQRGPDLIFLSWGPKFLAAPLPVPSPDKWWGFLLTYGALCHGHQLVTTSSLHFPSSSLALTCMYLPDSLPARYLPEQLVFSHLLPSSVFSHCLDLHFRTDIYPEHCIHQLLSCFHRCDHTLLQINLLITLPVWILYLCE